MDGSQVTQTLDSLWFFSNVLSPPVASSSGEDTENPITEEQTPNPITPMLQNQQHEDLDSSKSDLLTPRCAICGEFAPEIGPQAAPPPQQDDVEFSATARPETDRVRRRRKKNKSAVKLSQRRQIFGELDLGFDVDGTGIFPGTYRYGYGYGSHQRQVKMPPLDDGMAMKQHLKAWAYAVACNVVR